MSIAGTERAGKPALAIGVKIIDFPGWGSSATASYYQPHKSMTQKTTLPKSKAVFTVLNDKGLHTRPSTEIVKCAANFDAAITLTYKDETVNAKSLLGILFLAAERGAKITVEAEGPDAEAAVAAILKLANTRFHIKY